MVVFLHSHLFLIGADGNAFNTNPSKSKVRGRDSLSAYCNIAGKAKHNVISIPVKLNDKHSDPGDELLALENSWCVGCSSTARLTHEVDGSP